MRNAVENGVGGRALETELRRVDAQPMEPKSNRRNRRQLRYLMHLAARISCSVWKQKRCVCPAQVHNIYNSKVPNIRGESTFRTLLAPKLGN